MINPNDLLKVLKKNKIEFFSGVPDSVLKNFLNSVSLKKNKKHYVCVNEGSAVALAIGNYLASGKMGLVYLQNSGLGNALNPLISIADKRVYSIPMLLLIGWRGAPGLKDEPQHMSKGKITLPILKNLNIKFVELKNKNDFSKLNSLIKHGNKKKLPVAILIKKNTFEKEKSLKKNKSNYLNRSYFLKEILKVINKNDFLISSTGYTHREIYELRKRYNLYKGKDFYMVGGMGHTAGVALGSSIAKKNNRTICIDGDGSLLMHMGSLATVGNYGKKNFKYILLNNHAHESVGNQPTNSHNINFSLFAKSVGFKNYNLIKNQKNFSSKILNFLNKDGPNFLEIKINSQSMENLGRPKNLKDLLKNFLN